MTPQSFLDNFRYLANAPNGVDKLRELVLCLAMQGKLSERIISDTSADNLLEEVNREKQELLEEGLLRGLIQPIPVRPEEMNHPIPKEWKWVRFGQIAEHNAGKTLDQRRNTGVPRDYITTSNLYWGRFELSELRQMLIRDEELGRCTARKGDLLICEGGEAGRAAVWPYDKEVSFQNHVHRARFYAGINPYFVFRFLQKLNATGEINHYRKGVGISNMSGKALASIPLPLPPLKEQERIVAKVDEFMTVCDKLEAMQRERVELRPKLATATHTRFTENPTLETLYACFADPGHANAKELRKTILSLALQGKLVEQDEKDEVVNDSILISDRKFRSIDKEDLPWNIPNKWIWSQLGRIGVCSTGKTPPTKDLENYGGDIPFVGPGQISESGHILGAEKFITEKGIAAGTEALEGDILMVCIGGSIGKAAIANYRFSFNQQINAVRPKAVITKFGYLALRAEYFQNLVIKKATGSATPIINRGKWEQIPVPVPPLSEQRRIVAKVDELMTLVDKLELQQILREELAGAFAQSAVSAMTGTEFKPKPEKMKAPKTELISMLRLRANPEDQEAAPLAALLAANDSELEAKILWQRSGLAIEDFYKQLKREIAVGYIQQPEAPALWQVEESKTGTNRTRIH